MQLLPIALTIVRRLVHRVEDVVNDDEVIVDLLQAEHASARAHNVRPSRADDVSREQILQNEDHNESQQQQSRQQHTDSLP